MGTFRISRVLHRPKRMRCPRKPECPHLRRRSRKRPYEDTGGDERVFVQGVGRPVLPREDGREGDARVLRDAAARRRDQQHVLSDAERRRDRRMARASTRFFSLRHKSAASDHAREAAQGLQGRARLSVRGARGTEALPRLDPVSTAAVRESRRRGALVVRRAVAAGLPRSVRVPQRLVARARRLRRARALAISRSSKARSTNRSRGISRGPRTGRTCACAESSTRPPTSTCGSRACAQPSSPRRTSSSSTRTKQPARCSPSNSSASPASERFRAPLRK